MAFYSFSSSQVMVLEQWDTNFSRMFMTHAFLYTVQCNCIWTVYLFSVLVLTVHMCGQLTVQRLLIAFAVVTLQTKLSVPQRARLCLSHRVCKHLAGSWMFFLVGVQGLVYLWSFELLPGMVSRHWALFCLSDGRNTEEDNYLWQQVPCFCSHIIWE